MIAVDVWVLEDVVIFVENLVSNFSSNLVRDTGNVTLVVVDGGRWFASCVAMQMYTYIRLCNEGRE